MQQALRTAPLFGAFGPAGSCVIGIDPREQRPIS